MRIGSLFAGIGGLERGIERALGGEVIWQVEVDPWCREVLAKHWPSADRSVTDVRCATRSVLERVDVMCGGFPCQDVSAAGRGAGLSGERSGLWYEYLRLVRELQPRAVVVENVASGATRWLVPVRRMLETCGYRTRAIGLSASDVGAPHLRRRIFVLGLADANGSRLEGSYERSKELAIATRRHHRVVNPDWVECLMGLPTGWTRTDGQPARANSNTTTSRREPSKRARTRKGESG